MSNKKIIQEKINMKSSLLQDLKKAARARESSLREQVKMKKEKIRQIERRVAIDAGGTAGREYQKGSFRLYNTLINDAKREAKATEQELQVVVRENELNIRILEEEIKQLRAEKTIYSGGNMKSQMIKLSQIADSFEQSGNVEAGAIITETMQKISQTLSPYDKWLSTNPAEEKVQDSNFESVEVPIGEEERLNSELSGYSLNDPEIMREIVEDWARSNSISYDKIENMKLVGDTIYADLVVLNSGFDPENYEEPDYM